MVINFYFQGPENPPLVGPRVGKDFSLCALCAAGTEVFFARFGKFLAPTTHLREAFFCPFLFFLYVQEKSVSFAHLLVTGDCP